MEGLRTKRKIVIALVFTAMAAAVAEWFTLRAARGILQRDVSGCECASAVAGGWQQWAVAALTGLFVLGWIAAAGYALLTIWRTRRAVRRKSRLCGAFTFGFLRPKMAICPHCAATLSPDELFAVKTHEEHHIRRRDPLKFLILDILRVALFFVPLARTLVSFYRTAAEVEADEEVQNRAALGSALLRMTETRPSGSAASFASALTERIDRLIDPRWRLRVRISPRSFMGTAVVAIFVLGVLFTPSAPSATATSQCQMRPIQCGVGTWPTVDAQDAGYYSGSL